MAGHEPAASAHPHDRYKPFPLTDTQQAYWVGRSADVELGGVGCHGYWEWESPDLDVDRLGVAWRLLVDRHDMLRAVIDPDGRTRVLPAVPPPEIPLLDLRTHTSEQAEAEARRLRDRLSHRVMPADRWPLWDIRVTLLPGGRRRLHLSLDLLIADAWSYFHVLLPELAAYYENPGAALDPIELTFRDYVLASRAAEESARYRRSREYWLARLDELPPPPDLPRSVASGGSRKRVSSDGDTGHRARMFTRREHRIAAANWRRLTTRARGLAITPSGLLVAAFAEVLRTWSANEHFTINFPLFNRLPVHPHVDRLLGDFTTTSLLAVEKADGVFTERAQAIQQRLWADLDRRHFSGVRVTRELARRHGAGVHAAFPVVATVLLGQPPRQSAACLGEPVYTSTQTPQVSLDFQAWEADGELRYSWDSVDELFAPRVIGDMFGACGRLLDFLVRDDSAWRAPHFDLVPAPQLAMRRAVNATDGPVPGMLLHMPVREHAAARPAGTAVVCGDVRLSYAELWRRVNQAGRALRECGARPNQLVGVVMDKGWEQVVAAHGILAAGAAYLPISAGVPAARLRHLLGHGQVEVVLTQADVDARVKWPANVRRLCVDRDLAGVDTDEISPVQKPDDLAYVIYTSGSTGVPKGVMVDHRGAANTISDVNKRFAIGPRDRAIAVSGMDFDLSVYDLFGMTAAGGTVVIPGPRKEPDPRHWAELIATERVTFWNSVPTLMEILVTHLEGNVDEAPLGPLRLVILSGDWVPVTLPARIRALAGAARNGTARDGASGGRRTAMRVIAAGGPTETCVWSIMYPVGEVEPGWASIPYGRPMTNQRYHVLGNRLIQRPDWVPGEIHIESRVGLAKGYWRDPRQTAARFFRLPGSGERVYASGDVGRYLPDGTIEILGRLDHQLKILGHRVELGEIESVLEDHPNVHRAVVIGIGAGHGERSPRRLAAFVTLTAPASGGPAELRQFAAERLPSVMVPADVTILDELPLTPNGKVDRGALATARATPKPPRPAGPPSALEHVVADLWSEQLDVDGIAASANLIDLGCDSLTATRFIARVKDLFGVELTLRAVFDEPTVAGICHAMLADGHRGSVVAAVAEELWRLVDEPGSSLHAT